MLAGKENNQQLITIWELSSDASTGLGARGEVFTLTLEISLIL